MKFTGNIMLDQRMKEREIQIISKKAKVQIFTRQLTAAKQAKQKGPQVTMVINELKRLNDEIHMLESKNRSFAW